MATQALLSSIEATRQLLGGRPLQFTSRSLGSSRNASFVVKAASTPPVKADYTPFVLEMALMGFAEYRRFQDWAKPGSMRKQYVLEFEKFLGGSGDPAYPGGPIFNPLGFGKDEKSMKVVEAQRSEGWEIGHVGNFGYFIQALVTGVGPYQNLLDHLADPVNNNILTSLMFH